MSPLALLLVGSTLLDRESTSMGLSKDIVQISLFRLIIAPFLTWIVGVALHLSTPAADCRRAGQRDAGRFHGHDLLPQV